jgi:hypothetical protein
MMELVILAMLAAVVTIAVMLGRSQARVDAGQQIRDAEAHAAAERAAGAAAVDQEREAREHAELAAAIQKEATDAAPPTLPPAARMDAVDRWARVRALQELQRRKPGKPRPLSDDDLTPPSVPLPGAPGSGRDDGRGGAR